MGYIPKVGQTSAATGRPGVAITSESLSIAILNKCTTFSSVFVIFNVIVQNIFKYIWSAYYRICVNKTSSLFLSVVWNKICSHSSYPRP